MRVILDTSVIVSGHISLAGSPAKILIHWRRGAFTLLFNREIQHEWTEVLKRSWLTERLSHAPHRVPEFLNAVFMHGEVVLGYTDVSGLIRDPFDEMFLACARLGRADYIVSVDKDLLTLGEFEGTKIVRPAAFLTVLDADRATQGEA